MDTSRYVSIEIKSWHFSLRCVWFDAISVHNLWLEQNQMCTKIPNILERSCGRAWRFSGSSRRASAKIRGPFLLCSGSVVRFIKGWKILGYWLAKNVKVGRMESFAGINGGLNLEEVRPFYKQRPLAVNKKYIPKMSFCTSTLRKEKRFEWEKGFEGFLLIILAD